MLLIDPDESAVVQAVAHQYLCESIGFKTIAKRLRARGLASRRGAGFSFTSVRSMLMNPFLTGRMRFNVRKMHLNRKSGRRVARGNGDAEHMERQDESLRILNDATFARIQEKMRRAARGDTPRAPRAVAVLTGLVYCQCGCTAYRERSENRKPEAPSPLTHVFTSDATVEALADRLGNSPRGLLLMVDELDGWFGSFNQYKGGRGSDVPHYLSMHRASALKVDRKSTEKPTIYVPHAAVSIAGGIQPQILREALTGDFFANGLAARLLLAMPPARPKKWTEAEISHSAENAVLVIFT